MTYKTFNHLRNYRYSNQVRYDFSVYKCWDVDSQIVAFIEENNSFPYFFD